MKLSTPDTVLARTDWRKVALIHLGGPVGVLLLTLTVSSGSLDVVFSMENLLATTRYRTPYIFIPALGVIVAFLVVVPLIFAFRRGKMIWTDHGLLRAPYFQSFPLAEIEASSLRLLDDRSGTELIFVLKSGTEASINLVYAKYDRVGLVDRIRDLAATAQRRAA
jgi:hypothetical protein